MLLDIFSSCDVVHYFALFFMLLKVNNAIHFLKLHKMSTTSSNNATPGSDSVDSFDNNHVSHVERKKKYFITYVNACCKLFLKSCDEDST